MPEFRKKVTPMATMNSNITKIAGMKSICFKGFCLICRSLQTLSQGNAPGLRRHAYSFLVALREWGGPAGGLFSTNRTHCSRASFGWDLFCTGLYDVTSTSSRVARFSCCILFIGPYEMNKKIKNSTPKHMFVNNFPKE